MAEELRKAELVRDRLEGLARLMGSYPEGHDMRRRLEALDVERALDGVNEDIRVMTNALLYPGWYLREPCPATGGLSGGPTEALVVQSVREVKEWDPRTRRTWPETRPATSRAWQGSWSP